MLPIFGLHLAIIGLENKFSFFEIGHFTQDVLYRLTVQTQIRLLLKKQLDLGLASLVFRQTCFFIFSPDNQHLIWERKKKIVRNLLNIYCSKIMFENFKMALCFISTLHRRFYMSAHMLLNLLNELGKSDKMQRTYDIFFIIRIGH